VVRRFACALQRQRLTGATDRELFHINPKGRPVKQCEHCRGARKSKAHHAKCDCGDKKDKDKLKDKGDAKGEIKPAPSGVNASDRVPAHDSRCQCHSGGKCLCGTKVESDDLKIDTSRRTLHDARAKPKLLTAQSEPHLTVFANGHHKPCHRNNNSAHVSGAPYKIPRPHTLHGHNAFASLAQGGNSYSNAKEPAARSMDTLSLSNNDFHNMFGSDQRSLDTLPMTTMASSLDTAAFQDPLFATQNALFAQESNSPGSNEGDAFSTQQWPWSASSVAPINGLFAFGSISTSPSQECLPSMDSDWSIPSAGFNPVWSAGDLPLDPSKFTDSLTQPISHSGESKQSGPGLTAASSVHSEACEPNMFGELDIKPPQSAANESLFWEDSPVYRFSTSMPSEVPASMSATSVPDMQIFESSFAKGMNVPTSISSNTASGFAEAAATSMPSDPENNISIDPWEPSSPFGGMTGFDLTYPNNWF
jgi:hypothetical protein